VPDAKNFTNSPSIPVHCSTYSLAMVCRISVVLVVLACSCTGGSQLDSSESARQQQLEASWSNELATPYKSPIKRVVNLLNKMKAELLKESSDESAMYDKMVCWCETNEKEKTKAIAAADAKDSDLSAEIESRSADFGRVATEIEALKKQIAEDTETLKKATAIRENDAGGFRGEEKDIVQAVTNLKNAIAVLSRHQKGGSLIQIDGGLLSGMRVLLRDAALKYELLTAGTFDQRRRKPLQAALLDISTVAETHESQRTSNALLSALDPKGKKVVDDLPIELAARLLAESAGTAKGGAFLQQPIFKSYFTRSSQIYGILSQMLEEFEAQLSTSQKDELKAAADYEALAKAKEEQIAAGKEKLDDLEESHAANQKALSDAKEDLELTRKQRSEDVEFLRNLKLTCNDLDAQWEKRSKTRSAEIVAVSETIAILTEDDNRELLHKTVTFLQLSNLRNSASAMARRNRAAEALQRAAQSPNFEFDDLLSAWNKRGSSAALTSQRSKLATLALSVRLDSFTKVKEMMDKMVADLKTEQEEEVKFKAYCVKSLDKNEKEAYTTEEEKQDLEAKLARLAALIKKLEEEIKEAKVQIADTEVEIKKASENREKENAEFQTTVADQRATQDILKKALLRLQDFYTKSIGKAVLAQRSVQTPPVKFNAYKVNKGSSPVMGLIEQIIEDSVKLETEATAAETQAQAAYEKLVKDSNALIAALSEAVTAKTAAIADAKVDSAETSSQLQSTVDELKALATEDAELHQECDFVLKNFDIRQRARLQEIEAIQQAKAILSGAAAQ